MRGPAVFLINVAAALAEAILVLVVLAGVDGSVCAFVVLLGVVAVAITLVVVVLLKLVVGVDVVQVLGFVTVGLVVLLRRRHVVHGDLSTVDGIGIRRVFDSLVVDRGIGTLVVAVLKGVRRGGLVLGEAVVRLVGRQLMSVSRLVGVGLLVMRELAVISAMVDDRSLVVGVVTASVVHWGFHMLTIDVVG